MTRQRIVTGFDDQGRSVIVSDGPWPGRWDRGEDEPWDDLWIIGEVPAPLDVEETTSDGAMRIVPAGNEIAVRVLSLPPDSVQATLSDTERAARQHRIDWAEVESLPGRPEMHRTPTLDIGILLAGEVDLELDSGQVAHLKPGDSVIQRGTVHTWRVTGDVPGVMAFVNVRGIFGAPGAATSAPAVSSTDTGGTEHS
jgi:uncharacterized cupin superfamily protein